VLHVLFVWGCGGWYGKVFVPFIFAIGEKNQLAIGILPTIFRFLEAYFSFKQQFYSWCPVF
jgi:putative lipoprotein (fragment)